MGIRDLIICRIIQTGVGERMGPESGQNPFKTSVDPRKVHGVKTTEPFSTNLYGGVGHTGNAKEILRIVRP